MPDGQLIKELRPPKQNKNPFRPYGWLHEHEPGKEGLLRTINTLFLTNKECSFKCVMCDLWKDTLDTSTPDGAIPEQIRFCLDQLPVADDVKLYNNGNFFDKKAIPPKDLPEIAQLLKNYKIVLVENHPKLCTQSVLDFRNMIEGDLEVAMGLESIHPAVLPRLNKQITTDDFKSAADFLNTNGIHTRAFILLNPPFLTDPVENIEWCLKSIEFAFSCGIETCSIIPTRPGNGIMDKLLEQGEYVPPALGALEEVFSKALKMNKGRVFADIWDLEKFSDCRYCFDDRKKRLHSMNMEQSIMQAVACEYCGGR